MVTDCITLDGRSLTIAQAFSFANHDVKGRLSDDALLNIRASADALTRARATRAVYGATTGVGANKAAPLHDQDDGGHASNVLRSHSVGWGPLVDGETTRVAMAIRLNQFAAGGSGISPEVAVGLLEAINGQSVPHIHDLGAIGTADLGALADMALALAGEGGWAGRPRPPVRFGEADALPFISSSALTLARGVVSAHRVRTLLRVALAAAALSWSALGGSAEAFSASVFGRRQAPQEQRVAEMFRQLCALEDVESDRAHVQDSFGLRVIPQVFAASETALSALEERLSIEINAAVENPLTAADGIRHHGQFHLAGLASHLDSLRQTLLPLYSLSAARLASLMSPSHTALPAFLANGSSGNSGLLMTEYVVQDELASSRVLAQPVGSGTVSISLGVEEHASFATQSARFLQQLQASGRTIFSAEILAAATALQRNSRLNRSTPISQIFTLIDEVLPSNNDEHPVGPDISKILAVFDRISSMVREVEA